MILTKELAIVHGNISNAVDFIRKELHLDLSGINEFLKHLVCAKQSIIMMAWLVEIWIKIPFGDVLTQSNIISAWIVVVES